MTNLPAADAPPATADAAVRHGLGLSLTAAASISDLVEEAVDAETLGYDEVWTAEAATWDAVSLLSAVAARTSRIHLGVGVLNVTSRSSHALATAAASISALSAGRFTLGLGSASPVIVRSWHGVATGPSVAAVRRTATQVRCLLAGERVVDGLLDVRLAVRPPGPVPVVLAALGPRMVDLAGEVADGVVTVFATPSWTQALRSRLSSAERRFRVVTRLFVPVPGDDGAALDGVRDVLAAYACVPAYGAHFQRLGFDRQASAAATAMASRDRAASRAAIDDDMVQAFSVCGRFDEQLAAIGNHLAAGTDVAALAFLPRGRHDHGDRALLDEARRRFAEAWPTVSAGRRAVDDHAAPHEFVDLGLPEPRLGQQGA